MHRIRFTALSVLGASLALIGLVGGAYATSRLLSVGETRPERKLMQAYSSGWTQPSLTQLGFMEQAQQPKLLSYVPTYYKDVKPILDRNCTGCHTDGGIGPFALDDPKKAVQHARAAQFAVQSKRMPPWLPAGDSPAFRDELKLSDDDIAIIANWAWAGAPLGKTSGAGATNASTSNAKPDLILDLGTDFKPNAKLTDEYRCFVLDPGVTAERFLSGYGIQPGNATVVHHVLLFQVTGDLAQQARELERKADGRGGYECFGGPGVGVDFVARFRGQTSTSNVGYIGAWTPGSSTVNYPDGTGVLLKPGDQIIVQMHYNMTTEASKTAVDRTKARVYFAPQGEKRRGIRPFVTVAPVEIACPNGHVDARGDGCNRDAAYDRVMDYQEANLTQVLRDGLLTTFCKQPLERYKRNRTGVTTSSCEFQLGSDRTVFGVQGHMHLLGKSIRVETNPDDPKRRRVVLDIPRWDFHWQSGYWLKEPFDINKGDAVRVTCTHDNTAQNQPWIDGKQQTPRYMVWGEGTTDEMCIAALYTALR
jgi:mono/diheme cytochrome c family protein